MKEKIKEDSIYLIMFHMYKYHKKQKAKREKIEAAKAAKKGKEKIRKTATKLAPKEATD